MPAIMPLLVRGLPYILGAASAYFMGSKQGYKDAVQDGADPAPGIWTATAIVVVLIIAGGVYYLAKGKVRR
jgi:hypothetical protein